MTRDYIALAAQYQADVLAGTIPACRWVRLAMERNRRDLDRQETEAFPYRFDPDAGRRICQVAELLPHVKGPNAQIVGYDDQGRQIWATIVLEPWQCWVLTTLFGWVGQDGLRRFRVGLILVPRKNAKSTLGAVIALAMLTVEKESGAEVYSAATTRDQAKVVAEIAWEMAKRSPQFREHFGVKMGSATTRSLSVPALASKFMPLSADANSLDGLNVFCAIVDELHAHKTRAVWDVLDTATGARLQPLLLAITTAGVEIGGICHEKLGYLEKILDGVASDEAFFGINYTIDLVPHLDVVEPIIALEELQALCSCNRHAHTNIAQFMREEFARLVTTDGIDAKARRSVGIIQTETLKPGACATPATSDGSSKPSRNAKKNIEREPQIVAGSGLREIGQNVTLPTSGTYQILPSKDDFKIGGDSTSTESQQNNTIDSTPISAPAAPSASVSPKSSMSITAIVREWLGDCCVSDAIVRSLFSATLRKVYSWHSPTCNVLARSRLRDDGRVEIDRQSDDMRSVYVQRKANPNYGVSVQVDDLARKIAEAQHSPAALNNVLTKHLNVWIRTESSWMTASLWQTCMVAGLTIESLKQYPCWIGVDLGEVRDPSALTLVFKLTADTYAVIVRIYWPEDGIAKAPTAQLAGWAREGFIIVTPGNEADYARIRADLVQFFGQLDVQEIDFDRKSARLMMQDIRTALEPKLGRDRVEQVVLDIPQSVETMDPAMKTTEGLVLGTRIQHDGNPVMAWMVSNVVIERNHKGEIYPRKAGGKDSANKIDGPVSMFTAVSRAMIGPPPKPRFQVFFAGSGVKK